MRLFGRGCFGRGRRGARARGASNTSWSARGIRHTPARPRRGSEAWRVLTHYYEHQRASLRHADANPGATAGAPATHALIDAVSTTRTAPSGAAKHIRASLTGEAVRAWAFRPGPAGRVARARGVSNTSRSARGIRHTPRSSSPWVRSLARFCSLRTSTRQPPPPRREPRRHRRHDRNAHPHRCRFSHANSPVRRWEAHTAPGEQHLKIDLRAVMQNACDSDGCAALLRPRRSYNDLTERLAPARSRFHPPPGGRRP